MLLSVNAVESVQCNLFPGWPLLTSGWSTHAAVQVDAFVEQVRTVLVHPVSSMCASGPLQYINARWSGLGGGMVSRQLYVAYNFVSCSRSRHAIL